MYKNETTFFSYVHNMFVNINLYLFSHVNRYQFVHYFRLSLRKLTILPYNLTITFYAGERILGINKRNVDCKASRVKTQGKIQRKSPGKDSPRALIFISRESLCKERRLRKRPSCDICSRGASSPRARVFALSRLLSRRRRSASPPGATVISWRRTFRRCWHGARLHLMPRFQPTFGYSPVEGECYIGTEKTFLRADEGEEG